MKCSAFVVAPLFPSLTATVTSPSFARSVLEIAAESVVELTTVVARLEPFHITVDVLPNEPPAAVSVSDPPPASASDGEIELKVSVVDDVPDDNDDGCAQEMSNAQSATTRAMVAFSRIMDDPRQ